MKKIIAFLPLVFFFNLLNAQPETVTGRRSFAEKAGFYILRIDSTSLLTWGIGIVVLLVVGYLVYRFFKSTEEKKADLVPVIKNVYPNPSHGPITIEIQGHASQLKVLNMSGQPLGAFAVTGGELHFDLSSMPRGKYLVVAYYGATESNSVQLTLQ